ncbi:MAG TPA: wax ester/triacylglycerol synthase family O-acyltransferase, partial [Solirubrobacteraceae bacterium]|nr:wax ester/triacylglycerol synthase family O-acyltransferase [Solirubrobacteraceae bacterium]
MSLQDASFLYIEDGVTPMHVGSVAIFEGPPPTHEELCAAFNAKLHLVPRYRQTVRLLPWNLGLPLWVDDRHFNLDYHVRRSAVPAPGGRNELNNLVGRVMSQHLDRARPLWEVWAVEGLEDGCWALVSKVHHAMVDGVAATDLMSVVFDAEPDPAPVAPAPWRPERELSTVEVVGHSLAGALSPFEQLRGAAAAVRAPARAAKRGVEAVRGFLPFVDLMRPHSETSLNGDYGPHRRWISAHTSLDDIKSIRRALGGTVNDVVLAVITRGFRDLLAAREESLDDRVVRTMVPVSVRAPDERGEMNNRVSAVFVDLPVGLGDPVERLEDIRRQMDGLKESQGAVAGERLVRMAGFAPPMLAAMGGRLAARLPMRSVNTVTTNVPGPQHPLYFAGRRMLETTALIPLATRMRVAIGIFSYDGNVTFGVTGAYETAPDIDVLCRGIEE